MTSPATPADAPAGRHPFERAVDEVKPSKTDLNSVIMDYLVNEGYPGAAKKFAVEANIQQPEGSMEYIKERVEIRNAIFGGDIKAAIEKVIDLNPAVLDRNPSLHFALLRLQLIELIRPCINNTYADITPALTFAQNSLAPRAPADPSFLADLEKTMALLIFSPESNLPPDLAVLLKPELRQDVAASVNGAILRSQGLRSDTKLQSLVKLRAWAERKAREQKRDLPAELEVFEGEAPAKSHKTDDAAMGQDDEEPDMEGIVSSGPT